jgi:UDP-glucose 4-epimerase
MAQVLLTGASSFSGLWIAEALVARGHLVMAPLKRSPSDYSGLRGERVARLSASAEVVFEAPFGSGPFADLIEGHRFDLLAHHAADIPNYRSPDYDVIAGVARNVEGARDVFRALARRGAGAVVATGTAFESGEGGDGPGALAVSPYGLSKALTNETFRHFARWEGLRFGKVVIAGPFGVLEEGRFAWSMFQAWFAGRPGEIRTPRYVRDNIPAPLLGRAYADLVDVMLAGRGGEQVARPQGFVGTQEAFGRRLAAEMAPRLELACAVEVWAQPVLAEPEVRINAQSCLAQDWDERGFWDDYAAYYQRIARDGLLGAPA